MRISIDPAIRARIMAAVQQMIAEQARKLRDEARRMEPPFPTGQLAASLPLKQARPDPLQPWEQFINARFGAGDAPADP